MNLSFIFHFLGGFLCGALGRWWNRLWLLAHTDDLFYPLFLFGVYTGVGGYFSSIPVCFCYCRRRRCCCCCFVSNSLLSLPLVVLLSYIPFAAILYLFPLCFFFSNSLDIWSFVENQRNKLYNTIRVLTISQHRPNRLVNEEMKSSVPRVFWNVFEEKDQSERSGQLRN